MLHICADFKADLVACSEVVCVVIWFCIQYLETARCRSKYGGSRVAAVARGIATQRGR